MSALSDVARASAEELVAQLRDTAGDLPDEWRVKAHELADAAVVLATDRVSGNLTDEQFETGKGALVLTARSIAAQVGLDVLGQRRKLAEKMVPVIVRGLVALATGGAA